MRTTIRLDDQLLRDAKVVAAESGRTLNEVIEDALREALLRRRQLKSRERVSLPVFKGGHGVRPGIDLHDSAALNDLMDRSDRMDTPDASP